MKTSYLAFFSFFVSHLLAQSPQNKELIELDAQIQTQIQSDEFELALELAEKSLQKTKDFFGTEDSVYASKLQIIGKIHRLLGNYPQSEKVFKEALAIHQFIYKGKTNAFYANIIFNLGILYFETNEFDKSERCYLEAKKIIEPLRDKEKKLFFSITNSTANLYAYTERFSEAFPLYQEAKILIEQLKGKDSYDYALILNNIGSAYSDANQDKEALPFYIEAREIWGETVGKQSADYATVTGNLADLYKDLKQFDKAEPLYIESKNLFEKIYGKTHPEYALGLKYLASFYREIEQFDKAEPLYLEALNIYSQSLDADHWDLIDIFNSISLLYLDKNELQKSWDYGFKCIVQNTGKTDIPTEINENWFQTMLSFDYYSMSEINQTLELFYQLLDKQYLLQKEEVLLQKTYWIYKLAIELSKRNRNNYTGEEDKLLILQNSFEWTQSALETCTHLSNQNKNRYTQEAFAFAEANKSILLAEAAQTQDAYQFGDLPAELIDKEQTLHSNLATAKAELIRTKNPQEKEELYKQINELNTQIDAFKKEISQKYPKYLQLKYQDNLVSLTDLQKNLSTNTAFIEYVVTDSFLYAFYIDNKNINFHQFAISSELLHQKVGELRRALSDYKFIKEQPQQAFETYTNAAFWFYQNLIEKLLNNNSSNIQHLIIVPDGELGHLPFETFLTAPATNNSYAQLPYLLKQMSISYQYSAALFNESLRTPSNKTNGEMLAFAASYEPIASNDIPDWRTPQQWHTRSLLMPLPETKNEVHHLSQTFFGTFLTENQASEQNFKTNASNSNYEVLHFAMHGLLNTKNPMLSSLAFTENYDSTEDNFLHAYEISHLHLNANLVVLSACETGFGKFKQGEGILSLGRAFMYAGTPSLVVSLWEVNDISTGKIMHNFYNFLAQHQNKNEALRQAKLQYLSTAQGLSAHPAFWSAFVQIGDNRPIELTTKNTNMATSWYLWAGVALALSATAFVSIRRKKR